MKSCCCCTLMVRVNRSVATLALHQQITPPPPINTGKNLQFKFSGQAAFSRLGHDFTKSQKDARDILQVKAQTGTTAILHCNINAGPDVPVSRNLLGRRAIIGSINCFKIYWVKQAPDSPIIITDNKVIITDRRFHISEEVNYYSSL